MGLLLRIVVNAAALAVAAWIFPGIEVVEADAGEQVLTLLAVGVIFAVVNGILGTVVKILSLPFVILSLGLLLLVINALMLLLTGRVAESLGLGFGVEGFWTAVGGALVISIVSAGLHAVLAEDRDERSASRR